MNPVSIAHWMWNGLPWYVQLGAVGYVAFSSLGGTVTFYNWTKSWAGKWAIPAMLSLIVPLAIWLWTLLAKSAPGETHEHVSGKDAAPVVKPRTGTSKAKPAKSTRSGTLADFFKGLGK
jgi:hypothetical protein